MGNAQSPPADPRFASASRAFTPTKLEYLRSLYASLAAQSGSEGRYVSRSVFQTYFQLRSPLGERMFDFITQKRGDEKLTFEDLVIAKATYEKGTGEEIEHFIYQILDVNGDGFLGRSDMESVLVTMFDNVFDTENSEDGSRSTQDVVPAFLAAANFSTNSEGNGENGMSFEDLRSWFTLVPSARKFLGNLLAPPEQARAGWQVPKLLYGENINTSMMLLKKEYAWHIGGALSEQEQEEWKLLYHSSLHGLSFSTFLGNITNKDGKTILIVKDKEGSIFGGYASQPWERHGDFYGDLKSFIFQLHPEAAIYRPTGANRNIQWCAANFSSEDIPNGIGFGGKVNHFGLFISASFDQGQTFECTTFGSPSLSQSTRIQPEVVECWEVVQKTKQENQDSIVRGSVLERFKEDQNMLNLVGLANSSQ